MGRNTRNTNHTFLDKIQGFKGKVATFYTDAGTVGNYEQVFKEWAQGLKCCQSIKSAANVEDLIREVWVIEK